MEKVRIGGKERNLGLGKINLTLFFSDMILGQN